MLIWDADDLGANRIISDQCQSHDCRDKLDEFHYHNNNFRATLFAIPSQMTPELLDWCKANNSWIELAIHGFTHASNFECERMSYDEFAINMEKYKDMIEEYFVNGFKAPGWQISDDIYIWLRDHAWWVADQSYNNVRRAKIAKELKTYVNNNGNFVAWNGEQDIEVNGKHYHTWDCVSNGVYELSDQIKQDIKDETEFKFISEVL